MVITIEDGKDYFLRSDIQHLDWGPFDTEDLAWRHLFGRDSTRSEREYHQTCGWSVFRAFPPSATVEGKDDDNST
jgi:hypothetical protein